MALVKLFRSGVENGAAVRPGDAGRGSATQSPTPPNGYSSDVLTPPVAKAGRFGFPYPSPVELQGRLTQLGNWIAGVSLPPSISSAIDDIGSLGLSGIDLWHGSHVIVDGDAGSLYDKWKGLGAKQRESSHYKGVDTPQYELPFEKGALLFGKTKDGNTWFQMERHPYTGSHHTRKGHLRDYLHYQRTGENIGPFGTSPHTENNDPIHVSLSR